MTCNLQEHVSAGGHLEGGDVARLAAELHTKRILSAVCSRASGAKRRKQHPVQALPHFPVRIAQPIKRLAVEILLRGDRYDIHYWRTRSGLEVDFILGAGEVAVEVKGSAHVHDRELRPLRAFMEEHRPRAALVVSTEPAERVVGGIRIMPWERFLRALWAGDVIT